MNNTLTTYLRKPWMVDLLLFLLSFCVYFYYFPQVFFNPNAILSSITGDSLKNYYTFVYHIKNDPGFVNFAGMNFPFGEHVTYTDSHPGLTLILHYLPFTHDYLIGIMHVLIFLSYLIAPSVTNRIFMRLGFDRLSGFFISIGLTLLTPQFFRIYAGHFSMAYAFIIPVSILLMLDYFKTRSTKTVLYIFTYNFIICFIHLYPGFGLCLFNLFCMLVFEFLPFSKKNILKKGASIFVASMLPLILFKLFMLATDHHINRPTLPHGFETGVCTVGSLLVPTCGPFEKFMTNVFNTKPGEFEGFCYMGIAFIAITFLFIAALPFLYKKIQFKKETFILLVSSLILLIFSFGAHLKIIGTTNETLNQFRALGRFSWFFYYVFPIFIFTTLYHSFKSFFSEKKAGLVFGALTFLFFIFNTIEAGGLFTYYSSTYFQYRNYFSETYLNSEEKQIISKLKTDQPQAIIPLPTYNIGSEIYDRVVGDGLSSSLLSSFIYSYHTGLPIVSAMLSRNPIIETEDVINVLNTYKKERTATPFFNGRPFMVIKTNALFMPDEERILQKTTPFYTSDTLQFGYISQASILSPILDKKIVTLKNSTEQPDSNNVVFIAMQNKKPFLLSNSEGYENMFRLDSNKIPTGKYIVSLHYYHKGTSWKDMLCHFLLTKNKDGNSQWEQFISMRLQSGFYPGYSVFEYPVNLEKENSYDFIMKNDKAILYRISDFMLRPAGTSVMMIRSKNDTVYNNFPMY